MSQGRTLTSTVAVVAWDAGLFLADINVGLIVTALTGIGGALIWFTTTWKVRQAEAEAKAHEIWMKSHDNEIEREQARLKHSLEAATIEREKLAAQVVELTHRLDEKERTLVEFQGSADELRLEMEELLRLQMIQKGVIVKTTTRLLMPSSDEIPVARHPEPDPAPEAPS